MYRKFVKVFFILTLAICDLYAMKMDGNTYTDYTLELEATPMVYQDTLKINIKFNSKKENSMQVIQFFYPSKLKIRKSKEYIKASYEFEKKFNIYVSFAKKDGKFVGIPNTLATINEDILDYFFEKGLLNNNKKEGLFSTFVIKTEELISPGSFEAELFCKSGVYKTIIHDFFYPFDKKILEFGINNAGTSNLIVKLNKPEKYNILSEKIFFTETKRMLDKNMQFKKPIIKTSEYSQFNEKLADKDFAIIKSTIKRANIGEMFYLFVILLVFYFIGKTIKIKFNSQLNKSIILIVPVFLSEYIFTVWALPINRPKIISLFDILVFVSVLIGFYSGQNNRNNTREIIK